MGPLNPECSRGKKAVMFFLLHDLSGRFIGWVEDLFLNPPGLLSGCWVMAGFGVGPSQCTFSGPGSGLPPLWPMNEKQQVRNATFYISVNDLIYNIMETISLSFPFMGHT